MCGESQQEDAGIPGSAMLGEPKWCFLCILRIFVFKTLIFFASKVGGYLHLEQPHGLSLLV